MAWTYSPDEAQPKQTLDGRELSHILKLFVPLPSCLNLPDRLCSYLLGVDRHAASQLPLSKVLSSIMSAPFQSYAVFQLEIKLNR